MAGLFILAGAFAALAIDASRSFAPGGLTVTQSATPPARGARQDGPAPPGAILEPHPLLDHGASRSCAVPTFLGFGVLGVLALWLGRGPAPRSDIPAVDAARGEARAADGASQS